VTHPDLLVGADDRRRRGGLALARRPRARADDRLHHPARRRRAHLGADRRVNAASDVYAMGGRPLLALNLVGWNVDELSTDLLVEVLEGAQDAASRGRLGHRRRPHRRRPRAEVRSRRRRRGAPGPHAEERRAASGDALVLTKPLGIGVIATALKAGRAPRRPIDAAVASMSRLNADAADAARGGRRDRCTDVTGFGLLGHLGRWRGLRSGSRRPEIDVDAVPLLPAP
jgi:selenide, water dikinase